MDIAVGLLSVASEKGYQAFNWYDDHREHKPQPLKLSARGNDLNK